MRNRLSVVALTLALSVGGGGLLASCAQTVAGTAGLGATSTTSTTSTGSTPPTTAPPTTTPVPPGTRTRPAKLTGPGANAHPMFWTTISPSYYCPTKGTSVPTMIVYDDGSVLVSKYFGAYCDQVPTFTAGWIDPDVLAALAENYLDSPEAEVDMRTDLNVTDGPIDHIAYRAAGTATTRGVSVYFASFDVSKMDLPAEQVRARQAFNDLRATVRDRAAATQDWTATQAAVVQPGPTSGGPPTASDSRSTWPLADTPALTAFLSNKKYQCLPLTGAAARAVLAAQGNRDVEAPWSWHGKELTLAVSAIPPGWTPCQKSE